MIFDLNVGIPTERKHENVNWYLYTILVDKRDKILKKLNDVGVGAASYYAIPVHKTPYYKSKIKLPVTDWAASRVLSLPIHPNVTQKNIKFIANTLREIL